MDQKSVVLPEWTELPGFGLYLDQVMMLTAGVYAGLPAIAPLTAGMINSYVKGGLVDRPIKKKYSRDALSQLLMITFLKQTSSIDTLRMLLHPADGTDTESIYSRFREGFEEVSRFFRTHAELSRLDCAIAAAVSQTACITRLDPPAPVEAPSETQ